MHARTHAHTHTRTHAHTHTHTHTHTHRLLNDYIHNVFCHICCRKITLPEPPSAVIIHPSLARHASIVSEGPRVLPPPGLSFAAVERTTGGVSMEPIYLEKVHHDTSQTAPSLQQLCHITDCTITSTAMSHHRLHHHFNSYVTS